MIVVGVFRVCTTNRATGRNGFQLKYQAAAYTMMVPGAVQEEQLGPLPLTLPACRLFGLVWFLCFRLANSRHFLWFSQGSINRLPVFSCPKWDVPPEVMGLPMLF